MIDLSYLTEEEQEMIMAVLKRDADLKKIEDQRVKDLQKTMCDKNKLKYMTGEWFYETKSQRHRDRIHGSDIIRASIRQRKPVTVFELSKMWAEKPSFMNSGNRDVFIPPELSGLIDEPQALPKTLSREHTGSPESQPDVLKASVQPLIKQRLNPFNNKPTTPASPDGESQQVSNGTTQAVKALAGELLPSYESPIVTHTNQTSESSQQSQATLNTNKPVPRKRILHVSQDSSVDRNGPSCKQGVTLVPRGILKNNSISSSCSSSNDSLPPQSPQRAEPLSPIDHPGSYSSGSASGSWLDRKHVRFSGIDRGRNPALQNGRELGEHGLLDHDSVAFSDDEEGQTDKSDTSISSSNGDDVSNEGLSSPREECDSPFFSKTLEKIEPELSISSSSSPQDSNLWACKVVNYEEVKTGELQNSTEGSLQKDSKEGEALWSTGVHSCVTEPPASEVSSLHTIVPDTGKTNERWPGSPTSKLTKEEGHSIAKVLDWFSQSSGCSGWFEKRPDMEDGSKDHEYTTGLEIKSSEESNSSEGKSMPKPSPKPRRGILALFSRAEVKEGCSKAATSAEDEASYPDENKEAACHDVPWMLDEERAPLLLEEMRSVHEGIGISVVHSTSQRTLCNVKENCDQKESFETANKFFKKRADRQPNILTREEGDAETCIQIDKLSKVLKQDEEGRPSHFDHNTVNMNNLQSVDIHQKEKYIRFEHGKSDISVKPADERGTSTNYSISSMKGEKLGGSSQGTDSVDAHQENKVPMYLPSLDTRVYIPPLKLSLSLQEGKAILIKNLKALWEEEKMKYNLGVTKEMGTSDWQAEQGEMASAEDSVERLLTPGIQTAVVTDSHQDREEPMTSLNRENSTCTMLSVKDRETVAENEPQSEWMGDSLKQTCTLQHTKKPSPLTETKIKDHQRSLCSSNSNQFVNLNRGKSTPRSQRKSASKADPVENWKTDKSTVNSQQKGQAVAHSPKGQSKIPRQSSYKMWLDSSPLKTYAIDIGAERSDGSTSEDQSTTYRKHSKPSPERMQPKLSKGTDIQKIARYQTKRRSSEERLPATCTDEQAQPLENSTPKCLTKSASKQTSRTSSTDIQGVQNSPRQVFPEDAGVVKQHKSPSPHVRTVRGHNIGSTFRVTKDSEVNSQPAKSVASLERRHGTGIPEQIHVPVILDTSEKNSKYMTEDISREEVMGRVSSESSPSHLSHQSSVDLGSSRSSTPEPWSYSWASSAYNSPDTSPLRTILKRASRPMSLSKSLEDITTMPAREERMRTDQRSDLMLSADDVSVVPSLPSSTLDPEQMKRMSASVPAFLQQESDDKGSDCTSESSFYSLHRPQKRNSHTNHSFSSGMVSMSSSVSGSVMSICSGDIGNVDVKGTIQFAMNYVEKLGEFHIFVVQCRDLAVGEPKRNRSDPYVKCYLLPDKAKLGKRKTSVKKKTLNPTFNEILRYKISLDTLRSATLNLSVWHNDNFGRNSFLGEVDVDLRMWNISDTHMKDYLLRPRVVTRPKTTDQRGEMRVALRFLPQVTQSKRASKAGEVQIWVRECKSLPVVRGVIIDPFVKCTVLPDTSRKSRQKTRVAKKTADPVFNHTMVYDGFKPEDLQEACVELTVWDHDRLNNHFLGGLRLGPGTGKSHGSEVYWMDSTAEEATLWNRMMMSPGEWVEDVLPLRMLMMARSIAR